PLKVIVVPHSHSDPGWQKTIDRYFEDQTRHTLNNMVEKLVKFPKMTFIWAESVFLSLWWRDLDPGTQSTVRMLIQRGQLEIVVGSWVVPDEANPHYFALVDQMIEGHEWLRSAGLAVKPRNVWSLDPFGYSSTLPFLYQQAGYDNMVILRVHEKVKAELQNRKSFEFNWRQHWDHHNRASIFTQMMPYRLYNIKHSCGPDTSICLEFDFRKIAGESSESRASKITDENVDAKSRLLLSQYIAKNSLYKHNVVLIPIGDDFRFDRNIEWDQQYDNYQKLFDHINSQPEWNVHARFGTIQTYFNEVKASMQHMNSSTDQFFPSLSGDFFPYTDELQEYWTGYFTTRPYDKMLSRELEVNLRSAEILTSLARGIAKKAGGRSGLLDASERLTEARRDLALFQHHDGITGTEKSWVVTDYEQRLIHGLKTVAEISKEAVTYLLAKSEDTKRDTIRMSANKSWRLLSDEQAEPISVSKSDGVSVILFNSLGRQKEELVQLSINTDSVIVTDDQGRPVTSQINPVWTSDSQISSRQFELVFLARLNPVSLHTFQIKAVKQGLGSHLSFIHTLNHPPKSNKHHTRFQVRPATEKELSLENDALRATFSASTGFLQSVTTKHIGKTTRTAVDFRMYKSRNSGAYLFGPAGPAGDSEMDHSPLVRTIHGPLVSEIHVLQTLVNHTVRIYNTTGHLGSGLEITNIVDMRTQDQRELIMHFDTSIENTDGTFYTDQNGLQSIQRRHFKGVPTEANYYPFTAYGYLQDSSTRLTLAAAQPLGISSQDIGRLEVMLDRRLRYDDRRGLGEGVLDNRRTPSRFFLLVERSNRRSMRRKSSSSPLLSYPSLSVHLLVEDLRHYALQMLSEGNAAHKQNFSGFARSLPCGFHLVNLRSVLHSNGSDATLLLHRYAQTCVYGAAPCSLPSEASLSLASLFNNLRLTSASKASLSLMYDQQELKEDDGFSISMSAMDLHAYRLK
ncbi:hypothetical protein CAPTEDRAFT_72090, partial [Capitella teleta]